MPIFFSLCNTFVAELNLKKEIILQHLGARIVELRKKKNLTQFDLAVLVNKDRQSIQRLEKGNINPTIFYLAEIAEGLEIDLRTLTAFDYKAKKKKSPKP